MPQSMSSYHSVPELTHEPSPASPHSTTDSALSLPYHSPMTATSMPGDIQRHQTTSGNYTTSAMLPGTLAPSYPLYSYPQAQSHQSASLLDYTPQGTQQAQHQPSSWDSGLSIGPGNSVTPHGIYSLGTSHGLDQYQMNHNTTGV